MSQYLIYLRLLSRLCREAAEETEAQVGPQASLDRAVALDLKPIRADEKGKILPTFSCGEHLIFVPERVTLGSRKEITNVKVHVFFAAGGVVGDRNNDIALHGLRAASDQSEWITIGVQGKTDKNNRSIPNPIGDVQISHCLQSIGINSPPVAIRLTGHSRGCLSVVAAVKMVTTPIERIVFLDQAVSRTNGVLVANRVKAILQTNPKLNVHSYESANLSGAAQDRRATYHILDGICVAAIGAVRLIQDAMELHPTICTKVRANAEIMRQLDSLHLPPRGSFITTPSTGTQTNINDFCSRPTVVSSAKVIMAAGTLTKFIVEEDITRYDAKPGIKFNWRGFEAHEFFVAEVAHELTE